MLRVRAGAYFAAHANSSLQSGLGLNAAPPLCPPSPARAPKRVLFPGGVRTAARSGDPAGPLAPPAPFPSGHLCTPKPCSHACRLAPWRSSRPCYFSGSRRTRRGTSGSSSCRLPGCAARILTASGDLGAADACTRRALGRAIPLAGRGEGWSAPQLPLAHLTNSPRSLLVPVGDFISRTRSLRRSKPAAIGTR